MTGSGSSWTNRSALAVGALSRGTLTVANGGQVSSSGDSAVGLFATGTATVTGAGSAWTSIGNLTVGSGRSGTLTLSNGGRMSVGGGGGTVSVATDPTVIGALNIGAAAGQAAVAAGTLLAGTVSFGSGTGTLVFNHTGNPDGSAVTFAPSITGAGSVRQIAGTTLLSGANTYTGGTTVSGGVLNVGRAGALGASANELAVAGGTLDLGGYAVIQNGGLTLTGGEIRNGTLSAGTFDLQTGTVSAVLDGPGRAVKSGAGTVTLSGANTYNGGTAIVAGTLQLGSGIGGGSSGSIAGDVINDGTLAFNRSNALTVAGIISGTGRVAQIGSGRTTLSGSNTYSGGTVIDAGTLSVGADANLGAGSGALAFGGGTLATTASFATARNATLNAGGGTVAPAAGTVLTASGVISGIGSLTVSGGGSLALTGTNTYTGATRIIGGTLALSGTGSIGSSSTVALATGGRGGGTGSITGDVANAGTLAFNRSNALSVAGVISGTGAVTQIGAGTTTLSGVNTYSGGTTIDAGILQVAADANLGASTGALTFGGGTLATTASFATARTATLNAGGGTVAPAAGTVLTASGTISGTGPLTVGGPGTLVLAGANTYTGATTINAGATLQLGAGAAAGSIDATAGITNNGALVADRSDTLTLAAPISGAGTLTQAGPGTTILTARSTYTGATTVNAGVLQIDGVLTASDVTVNRGGTLSGSGKIGDPLINAGGTLAPGSASSIGTLSITGPLTFAPGSFYTVKITPSANDRTTVTGTATLNGGTVQVLAGSGTYTPALRYTLLSATGGVTGTFSNLQTTSNLAFLTPSLSYDRNAVYLGFAQTAALTTVAATPNQIGPAAALNGVAPTVTTTVTTTDAGTTTRTAVSNVTPAAQVATAVLNQTAPGAVQALNALSGEVQASAISAITQTAFVVREAILDHLRFGEGNGFAGAGLGGPGLTGAIGQRLAPGTTLPAAYAADVAGGPEVGLVPVRPVPPGYGVWGQAFGAFGDAGDRNAARLTRQVGGFVLGAETGAGVPGGASGDWRAGLAAGYTFTALDITARQSTGQVESGFGAVYARGPLGLLQVRLGTAYAGDALDTRRAVLFPGFSQSVSGKTGGDTVQGFGEVGYRIGFAAGYVEPFVGGATVHIRRDGFAETGGAAALTVYGRSYDVRTATVGVQGQAVVADLFGGAGPLVARGLVGYRRAFGDVVPQALLAFAGGGQAFLTAGVPVARDAVVASAGLDWQVAERTTVGLSYNGQIGSRAQDHAVKGSFSYRW